MQITHVLSSFGMGGQERIAVDLAVRQRALGHRVTAISLSASDDGPHRQSFESAGISALSLPKKSLGTDPALTLRLCELFRRLGTDVVHTHNPQPLIYAAPAGKLAGARVIHTKHGANPAPLRQKLLRRAAALFADAYVAVSAMTAEVARRGRECTTQQLHVIENGIDLSRFVATPAGRARVRAELGIPSEARVIGTVGRLAPEKNQALMLEAVNPLLAEDVHVLVVGDGPERSALEGQAARLPGARSVHFLGTRRDTPDVLSALDVFVLSSDTEGLPLVIPEAMSVGLPVVSTAVGGIPNVVEHEVTGLLVPPGEWRPLSAALSRLVSDPALQSELGERARRHARSKFSVERMTERYLSLYANDAAPVGAGGRSLRNRDSGCARAGNWTGAS